MADRGDTHYHVPTLNNWFLISSLLLLVTVAWMVIEDWNAPWKAYQREFRAIELERANETLAQPEFVAAAELEGVLAGELEVARQALEGKADAIAAEAEALRLLNGAQFVDTEGAKGAKMFYNWERFLLDHDVAAHGDDPEYAEKIAAAEAVLAELELAMNVAAGVKETTDAAVNEQQTTVNALTAEVARIEASMKGAAKDLELVRARKDDIEPAAFDKQIAMVLRDFPGIDFIGPNMKVNKVVLNNLTFELNFTKKKRIDMCQTCHLAAEVEGYDEPELQEPYRSHPRLDLFLSSKSPHPVSEIGCTICHRGSGEALDFIRSDHRPVNEGPAAWLDDRQEWQDEHHWHKEHHWDYPMLTADYTEASCVQCHKTSMELIADDAPKVTEGYQLFDRYGCYACHKVDWFPNKRKPGPTLKNVNSKLSGDFMASWIAGPRDFRPTTWMPQIFHLENYPPDEVVVKSQYGAGRDIMGQEWNDSAVAAVTAYLRAESAGEEMAPIPVEGDPERGREVFRVAGCLACHNMAPYFDEETDTIDLAFERNGENEHGPNLRGVATKVNAEWLYNWIKDPQKYWHETRMPNLRLSDQDASDVTSYMMEDPDGIFTETPEGWEAKASPYDMETLREQARWFFTRVGRDSLESRFNGEDAEHKWDDEAQLLAAVGEKYVRHYGCYSCHEVSGMENDMPIGVELSNWGSKTTDKLDWGSIAEQMAHDHGWGQVDRDEFSHYREGWIEQKLAEPRSFDRGKVKNPTEKLRMPWFDFAPEEIRSIATFVVGLVDDEVQLAKMEPTADQLAMDAGKRAVRQHNCAACHMIAPGTISFDDESGHPFTLPAEIRPFGDMTTGPNHGTLEELLADIQVYEEDYEEEVEEVIVRLWDTVPGVGMSFSNAFLPKDSITEVSAPEGGDFVQTVVDYYQNGIEMFDPEAEDEEDAYYYWNLGEEGEVEDVDGVLRPYYEEQAEKLRWTFAPPVLVNEGGKLQRDWFYNFLLEPIPLRQQMRVKMPTFNFEPGQAAAIADYFAIRSAKEYPASYARKLRFSLGAERSADGVADGAPEWPALTHDVTSGKGLSLEELSAASGVTVGEIEGIESGYQPSINASFAKLKKYGDAQGFMVSGPAAIKYERIERRSASYLAARGDLPAVGAHVGVDGPKCFTCHWNDGQAPGDPGAGAGVLPIAWAPDLVHTKDRLREDWTHDWLWNPSAIYPGTSMPANFAGSPPEWQDQYPGSDNDDQIQAVLDWLYNFDQIATGAQN
jgi:cytochrome c2